MKRTPLALLAASAAVLWPAVTFGQCNSLYKNGKVAGHGQDTVRTTSLTRVTTTSDRDFKKHDLITIVIREQTRSKTVADSETDKGMSLKAVVESWPKFSRGPLVVDVAPAKSDILKLSALRNFEGGGSKRRDDSFIERITAEIVDIKPNGNLVLEATKQREWMGEYQVLKVTGIVRKQDVAEDNTVSSEHIAHLSLSYQTRGQVASNARRGLIDWILDLLNIF